MLGTHEQPGVMPQTLDHLFSQIAKATRLQTTTTTNNNAQTQSYKVSLSYLEIYNENIRDLLSGRPDYLELWEDRLRGSVVSGIERVEAKTAEDVLEWLEKGNLNRTQEATGANEASSRSHAVLQVFVAHRTCNKKGQYTEQNGKLSMIDLAGSERAADTKNRGMRMIEGASINRSLLALGNCINALTEEGNNGKYVNYRDSKLTRLLKDSLGGNCKTVMIANISPIAANFEETLNTLKYASRARAIKNKVVQQAPVPIPKPLSLMSLASKAKRSSAAPATETTLNSLSSKSGKSNMFQRLSDQSLAKHNNVQARYLGTAGTTAATGGMGPSKPSTGVNSMLSELENCLLECFQERKTLQKSMNGLDVRLSSIADKISMERKMSKGSRSEKLTKYEQKAVKLRALKKGLFKKSGEADDKVKSINQVSFIFDLFICNLALQTFPRSLDQQSQKYLESRIKSHFIEMENLKLEGVQSILATKLKKQEAEYSAFVSQLALLEAISTTQRDILDQNQFPIPDKLQEYYNKLKNVVPKPTSSGSDGSNSNSDSPLEEGGYGSSDASCDESQTLSRQAKKVETANVEGKPVKSGLLFPRIGLRVHTTVGDIDRPSAIDSTSILKLPEISVKANPKSSSETLANSHDTVNNSHDRMKSVNLAPKPDHVRFQTPNKSPINIAPPPATTKKQQYQQQNEDLGDSENDSEFSTTESPSAPLRTRPRQIHPAAKPTSIHAGPPPLLIATAMSGTTIISAPAAAKLKDSQPKTIREARQEIQHQIREARAERQRLRQSQELDARLSGGKFACTTSGRKQIERQRSNPDLSTTQRPPSEASKKVKVVAGKGIMS
ncbi:UNVERIFIED_CONTAM: Kinesin-like protein kif19 [Siphonaria sp. JEL0065]|nr:Kinesin-like protein kif19 [Siphonaria sp. JEL0065]